MTNKLVEEYLESAKRIEGVREDAEKEMTEVSKLRQLAWREYNDKTREITNKRHEKLDKYSELEKKIGTNADNLCESPRAKKEKVKRIIKMLEIAENFELVGMGKVSNYNNKGEPEWCDWIYNDDYLKIRAIVYENDRKVNKFSLSFLGNSAFVSIIKYPHHYSSDLNEEGLNIRAFGGAWKTVEECKAHIQKISAKLFKDIILEQHKALVDEYLHVKNNWKLSDFQELLEYKCFTCKKSFKKNYTTHKNQSGEQCSDKELYRRVIEGA